jgi:hypothetical protein
MIITLHLVFSSVTEKKNINLFGSLCKEHIFTYNEKNDFIAREK